MYDVSFLMRGKMKVVVLKLLDKPRTATQLSKKLKKHRPAISNILLSLESHGLATCINNRDVMYRYYQISDRGREALKRLKEFE